MSARGTCSCGIHGRGRGRKGTRVESSSLGSMPNLDTSETLVSPATETGGVTGVSATMVEYWLEATERIINDIDCTPKHKLKGVVSLLRDEGKYVGASYVDARRREFMNLRQVDRLVAEYEAEFLRLSRDARGMVESEYEKCVRFENGLRDNQRVLITPQREREFAILVDKEKIVEEVKRVER
ncbi:uncharacterized protein [Gossypium hirsutum]|uniref:Retrotransposon gag domain-containing protein n=1 Tax=Gossypium hirsutum TaxID=3635 RepID=A0A1U8PAU2_GOSHI|nr:uncharacterized protein LOC107956199 [Gossypium hirsutum]